MVLKSVDIKKYREEYKLEKYLEKSYTSDIVM